MPGAGAQPVYFGLRLGRIATRLSVRAVPPVGVKVVRSSTRTFPFFCALRVAELTLQLSV